MLPLVEFKLAEGITTAEALELIKAEPEEAFNVGEIAMNKV